MAICVMDINACLFSPSNDPNSFIEPVSAMRSIDIAVADANAPTGLLVAIYLITAPIISAIAAMAVMLMSALLLSDFMLFKSFIEPANARSTSDIAVADDIAFSDGTCASKYNAPVSITITAQIAMRLLVSAFMLLA